MLVEILSSIVKWTVGLAALLFVLDSVRALCHLRVARRLIKEGMSYAEAKEQSGANHWDQPLLVRIKKRYPPIPR